MRYIHTHGDLSKQPSSPFLFPIDGVPAMLTEVGSRAIYTECKVLLAYVHSGYNAML